MNARCERVVSEDGRGFAETGIVEFEGKEFSAGGAFYHPDCDRIVGYLSSDESVLTTGNGEFIGRARVTSRWKIPCGILSGQMLQAEVTVDGTVFTGRSSGGGMLYRGKRKRGK